MSGQDVNDAVKAGKTAKDIVADAEGGDPMIPSDDETRAHMAEEGVDRLDHLIMSLDLLDPDERREAIGELMRDDMAMRNLGVAWAASWRKVTSYLMMLNNYGLKKENTALEDAIIDAAQSNPMDRGRKSEAWSRLRTTKKGTPHKTLANVRTILQYDPDWKGRLVFDEFASVTMLDKKPISDVAETGAALEIADHWGLSMATTTIREALIYHASKHMTHPVRDLLSALEWDGKRRLHLLCSHYLGGEDTDLHRAYGICWAISAVARVFEPGCKADHVLVLQGAQGTFKSTAARLLAMRDEWFSDGRLDLRRKDAYLQLRGVWIYEMAELDGIRGREVTRVRSFLSQPVDHYVPPYGRNVVAIPRQCVFIGTTNEAEFLADPEGHRRWWPIAVDRPNIQAIIDDRAQLWAEAVTMYKAGEAWHLNADEEAWRAAASEEFEEGDPWDAIIADWTQRNPGDITVADVLKEALKKDYGSWVRNDENRVAGALKRLGFERGRRVRTAQGRVRSWTRPA